MQLKIKVKPNRPTSQITCSVLTPVQIILRATPTELRAASYDAGSQRQIAYSTGSLAEKGRHRL
jgi:hypothetical protein